MGCVYMRTSPNGESYIGQTSFTEERRWKQHCKLAFEPNKKDYNYPLSEAIRKYGPESFTCRILEDGIDNSKILQEREVYWINYYDTYRNGLNATLGGDGCKIHDTQKIKELWNNGLCVRDICLILNVCYETVLDHLNISKKEAKKRGPICKSDNLAKYFENYNIGRAIPVSCYDIKTGKLVKSFVSMYEASKFINKNAVKTLTAIHRAVTGRIKSAYGYYWKSGEALQQLPEEVLLERKTRSKIVKSPVVCIETNSMYSDSVYAQKGTGINYRSIIFTCKGQQQTAGGFHWRYATENDKKELTLLFEEKPVKQAPNIRAVKCLETGQIYSSLKEAGSAVGVSNSSIYNCCTGRAKTAGGYHWEYT